MRRRNVLAAAGLVGAGGQVAAQSHLQRFDFEDAAIGAPPLGFTVALTGGGPPPRWEVREDPTAPAGSKVLAETSRDRTDNRFPLVVLSGFSARDAALSVRFRAIEGQVDQAAGLVLRYRDAGNYYVARANAREDNVRLYRVVEGRRTQFAGAEARVPRNQWQTLGLRVAGDRFEVLLEGRVLFSANDRTFGDAGQVGLWTKADSLTHFDAFEVALLR